MIENLTDEQAFMRLRSILRKGQEIRLDCRSAVNDRGNPDVLYGVYLAKGYVAVSAEHSDLKTGIQLAQIALREKLDKVEKKSSGSYAQDSIELLTEEELKT